MNFNLAIEILLMETATPFPKAAPSANFNLAIEILLMETPEKLQRSRTGQSNFNLAIEILLMETALRK